MRMFFLLSGRPNLRRNVRELMSAELDPEKDGKGETVDVLETV